MQNKKIRTDKIVRKLPENAKIVDIKNGISLYNINTFQNIMSWNQYN